MKEVQKGKWRYKDALKRKGFRRRMELLNWIGG